MEVERKIRKIGNSLGVYLPSDMLKQMGAKEGDKVFISMEDGEIIVRSSEKKKDNDEFKAKVVKIIEEYMNEKDEESK